MLILYVCLAVLLVGRTLPWLVAYLSVVMRR